MIQMSSVWRSRWAAAGAAVAITLGGGSVFRSAEATGNTGTRAVFVAITPCRLFDTRPAPLNVGSRTAPFDRRRYVHRSRGPRSPCASRLAQKITQCFVRGERKCAT